LPHKKYPTMGMMHYTSGKNGYEYYQPRPNCFRMGKGKLIEVLTLEEHYRSSEEYQLKYSQKDDLGWFRDVTIEIQKRALLESGFGEDELDNGLQALWSARGRFSDDPEANSITVYQQKDRSQRGALYDDSDMPNVPLVTLDGEKTDLVTYCGSLKNPDLPLFLIGGSVS